MARKSPVFVERLALVDNPDEYYTIVVYLDLIEFLFQQYNTNDGYKTLAPLEKTSRNTSEYAKI